MDITSLCNEACVAYAYPFVCLPLWFPGHEPPVDPTQCCSENRYGPTDGGDLGKARVCHNPSFRKIAKPLHSYHFCCCCLCCCGISAWRQTPTERAGLTEAVGRAGRQHRVDRHRHLPKATASLAFGLPQPASLAMPFGTCGAVRSYRWIPKRVARIATMMARLHMIYIAKIS